MAEGTIRLFGPPAITVDGEDKLQVMPVKGFALLMYLCMEGGSHRRDRIAALLWPDAPESRGRGSLRTLLYDLNKIAPGLRNSFARKPTALVVATALVVG